MAGRLTTHALDTATGRPAAGMGFELWQLEPERRLIRAGQTNRDGRTDTPLIDGPEPGLYELLWDVGGYFGSSAFLRTVPVRFAIVDGAASYHVPLLVSPWAY